MGIEKIITDIFINLINAFLVPIVLPIFTLILKRDKAFDTRTDTSEVSIEKTSTDKPKLVSDVDQQIKLRYELPSAYFANLVWAVVYLYSNNFRTPFIILYYTLIVLNLMFIVFTTKDYSEELKTNLIKYVGIGLILLSLTIIFAPYIYSSFFFKNEPTQTEVTLDSPVTGG